jgi:6-pyruvoyltetrahydropterin/6-carboxytetrahydropterin synthase
MHSIRVSDRKMSFSSAHFVAESATPERLHGHNYQVEVIIGGQLNSDGMVLDFRDIKKRVSDICTNLDHRVLLPGRSQRFKIREADSSIEVIAASKRYVFPKEDCLLLPIQTTTAELLAEYIATSLDLPTGYDIQVCVCESPGSIGCYAPNHQ